MGKATEDLRKEHDSILHVLSVMGRMISDKTKEDIVKLKYYNELIYFLKIFADKCHHGKEELYLFKELIRSGLSDEEGHIGILLAEHNRGREFIDLMSRSLGSKNMKAFHISAAGYRELLPNHIARENNVLFAIADRMLDDARQDEISEGFAKHEESVIGHGVHERLHAMIESWDEVFEAGYGIVDT
jgi:hemerythrin-like domain-containing protein